MPYTFTKDWASDRETFWRALTAEFVGKPRVRFLEVGSYEGRSACWWLDNVLTGEGSTLTCVDPWEGYADLPDENWADVYKRFRDNTYAHWKARRLGFMQGRLRDANPDYVWGPFEFIYIDGSHLALDVLDDAVRAWDLLKVGGILLFDDYDWRPATGDENDCPKLAIDAFLACAGDRAHVLNRHVQVAVRKVR